MFNLYVVFFVLYGLPDMILIGAFSFCFVRGGNISIVNGPFAILSEVPSMDHWDVPWCDSWIGTRLRVIPKFILPSLYVFG
ncbi:hypothetical protein DFH11DRAFT_1629787, partial [Phellopilus nigrolimitatus]